MANFWYGKLTADAIPHHWYTIGGTAFILVAFIALTAFLTKARKWGWLWHEWLTSTDPKKIGTMYMVFAAVMFFRAIVDSFMIWLQQALAADSHGYLSADHF